MMKHGSFERNRAYIENEFENAVFDRNTGLDEVELYEKLAQIQDTPTEEPRQIVCAKAYAYLLDHVQLEINEHTPFSVKINIGVDYSSFAGLDIFDKAIFRKQREKFLEERFPEDYRRMKEGEAVGIGDIYTDFWHTVPNWERLIRLGFPGILKSALEVREALKDRTENGATAPTEKCQTSQTAFLDSVVICYQAILRLLERIYRYSLSFQVPEFSECIKNLIAGPPATMYEVMQFAVLYLYVEEIGCERGRSLGPIDRLYLPFYQGDLAAGRSREEIEELFRYFFIHFTATKRFAQQPFTICGCDCRGNDYTNELSHLILDVYDGMEIYDPKIHLRYHNNIDEKIFTKAISMIRKGHSSICLLNDEAVFDGYERLGIPREDAQNYVALGCYEPVIMGKEEAEVAISWINMAKSIEFALYEGRDPVTGKQIGYKSPARVESFERFFEIFLRHLDDCVDFAVDFAQRQGECATMVNPSPIYSSGFAECIEKGMDVHEFPLKYNNMSVKCFGLATAVDSLVVIKKYVFDRQEITLDELRQILKDNWGGFYDTLHQKVLKEEDKYGNNRQLPDELMQRITTHLSEKYCGMKLKRGGVLRLGLDSIDHCVYLGEVTGATPDGRYAGRPISKNLCAVEGMDREGITSYMQSILKIDTAAFLDSAILDFVLHPSAVEGEKGLEDFKSLIRVFFAYGGFAAQGNIVTGEKLKEAQLHPEKYSTLQIRVCGWNEYFVKLSKAKQDMFIRQSEVLRS